DRTTGARRLAPRRHQGSIVAVALHPDGDRVASSSRDGTVALWELTRDTRRVLRSMSGVVTTLAFSPDGRTLASGGSDRSVRLWDPVTGQARATFHRHTFPII